MSTTEEILVQESYGSPTCRTMTAVQCSGYGPIDDMVTVVTSKHSNNNGDEGGVRIPTLADLIPSQKRKDFMVIRTLAVALAPGDCRVLSGITKAVQGPPSLPYTPGGDCSGIVVEVPLTETNDKSTDGNYFHVGDYVACGFYEKPFGALGEYAVVSIKNSERVPDLSTEKIRIRPEQAAAIAGSSPAVVLCESHVREGDRVLVLGASGGMGSMVCQLSKHIHKASYVVGVASNANVQRLMDLKCCDEVINYNEVDIFTATKFLQNPFDIVIDLAGFAYQRLLDQISDAKTAKTTITKSVLSEPTNITIVKSAQYGGRFVTTVPPIGPIYEVQSFWQLLRVFALPVLSHVLQSRWTLWYNKLVWSVFPASSSSWTILPPLYSFSLSLTFERKPITKLLSYVRDGIIQPVLDPAGPFPFTTTGVRAAFHLQESRHAFGKVVISTVPLK